MDGTELANENPEGGTAIASTTRLANYLDEDEYETRQAAYELEHQNKRVRTYVLTYISTYVR